MTGSPDLSGQPDGFVSDVVERLALEGGVHRPVPGGLLHVDRPLPFLCVYRRPSQGDTGGAEAIVRSAASWLVVSDDPALQPALAEVIGRMAGVLSERFGSFLVLELWVGGRAGGFSIEAPTDVPATTVPVLADALGHIDVHGRPATVELRDVPDPGPPGHPPLLTAEDRRRLGVLLLGVELPLFFVDAEGRPYPLVVRRLGGEMAIAVQRAVFEFATVQTSLRPEDFRALGPRRIAADIRQVDAALATAAGAIDYLLAVTPVDVDVAWDRFDAANRHQPPTFHYRPLTVDPDLVKRELYAIPVEHVEDPTLAALFRAKRHELERQVNLLEQRGSDAFMLTSLQLFGRADPALVTLADTVLERLASVPDARSGDDGRRGVGAEVFAGRARAEVASYRAIDPEVTASVIVRADVPGVLVSGGDLLVGADVRIAESRVDALIQHEVGTHVVTEFNGRAQPLEVLRAGLPGYEETQEGLAVLAEFVVGGLSRSRLATLAARVLAVARLINGVGFVDTFQELAERSGLSPRRAFHVTMRVYRSGGLTKDAIYLRGLDRLLAHLAGGGSIDPLLVGKLPLTDVPIVEELQWRGLIRPPRLRPRWLEWPGAADRLHTLAHGLSVLDLVDEVVS